MSESDVLSQQEKLRRATLPNIAMQSQESRIYGRTSMDSIRSTPPMTKRDSRGSAPQLPTMMKPHTPKVSKTSNLDYLSLSNTPEGSKPQSPIQSRSRQSRPMSNNQVFPTSAYNAPKTLTATPTEWEVLLGSYDDRHLYDAIYGGGPTPALASTDTGSSKYGAWSPESWDYTTIGLDDYSNNAGAPQSVLSFSEESLSSGEDLTSSDLGFHHDQKHGLLGTVSTSYDYILDGFEGSFNL